CSGRDSNPRDHALRRRRPVHSSHRSLPCGFLESGQTILSGVRPVQNRFFTSLSRRLCGRLWCKTIPPCRPPAHPRMMLLEALSSSAPRISSAGPQPRLISEKLRHVCPPQTVAPYEKRSSRSVLEVQAGVEPARADFADPCVPVSPLHRIWQPLSESN